RGRLRGDGAPPPRAATASGRGGRGRLAPPGAEGRTHESDTTRGRGPAGRGGRRVCVRLQGGVLDRRGPGARGQRREPGAGLPGAGDGRRQRLRGPAAEGGEGGRQRRADDPGAESEGRVLRDAG